jgi:hypothetical protein
MPEPGDLVFLFAQAPPALPARQPGASCFSAAYSIARAFLTRTIEAG